MALPAKFYFPWTATTMTFPCVFSSALAGGTDARMFNVTSTDAAARKSSFIGARVALQFTLHSEGRDAVNVPVVLDLEAPAARALAQSLLELAEQAEALEPVVGW